MANPCLQPTSSTALRPDHKSNRAAIFVLTPLSQQNRPGCVSTAAGKYQINKPTWLRCQKALGLRDFSPASQDLACAWLIEDKGAMPDLLAGRFGAAVTKIRKVWASLPAAGYGQGERSLAWLTAKFEQAGGVVTA